MLGFTVGRRLRSLGFVAAGAWAASSCGRRPGLAAAACLALMLVLSGPAAGRTAVPVAGKVAVGNTKPKPHRPSKARPRRRRRLSETAVVDDFNRANETLSDRGKWSNGIAGGDAGLRVVSNQLGSTN